MGTRLLSYTETAELLAKYAISLAPATIIHSASQAATAAAGLGFPVALKLLSPQHTHKSEAGLVALGLQDAPAVRRAGEALLVRGEELKAEGLLVQKMAPRGVETLVGITQDEQFGPVIAFGSGGTLVEWLEDISLRLPPLSKWEAEQMGRETQVWRLLQGYRTYVPADVDALLDLLVSASRLADERAGTLVSMDLNPVFVLPAEQGLSIVDARVVVMEEAASDG
jgi:acyl-CoA synthetase (NDP forming)